MTARTSPGNGFQRWRRIVLSSISLISALLSIPGAPHAQSPAPAMGADPSQLLSYVRYQDGLLSVKAHRLPLRVLLAEMARLTGVEISVDPSTPARISAQFENLILQDALTRLFEGSSVSLVYREFPMRALQKAVVGPVAGASSPGTVAGAPYAWDASRAEQSSRARALAEASICVGSFTSGSVNIPAGSSFRSLRCGLGLV